MSKRKQQISQDLAAGGAAWATTDRKYVSPNDEFGASSAYHIHPDASYPHQDQVRRFDSLDEVEAYAKAKATAAGLWEEFKAGKITFEQYEKQASEAMADWIL